MDYLTVKKDIKEISNKIKELYEEVVELKKKRDEANELVKSHKEKREEINRIVKEKIEDVRNLKNDRNNLIMELKEVNLTKDSINQKINHLETIIETKCPSLERERELIGEIEYYRKFLEKSDTIDELSKKINTLSEEISEYVKKSAEEHQKVLEYAKISAENHQKLMEKYDEINKLKKQYNELYEKIKNIPNENKKEEVENTEENGNTEEKEE
ncbi:hypothetical protein KKP91_04355 [Methanothermococcus sp. SCGC AD-155-M21]|nr:hypothetical protein [Methanothermococcus sp. SCGC AD-155-M21]